MEERNVPFETFKMVMSALTSIAVGGLVVITYWYQVALFSILAVTGGACIVLCRLCWCLVLTIYDERCKIDKRGGVWFGKD